MKWNVLIFLSLFTATTFAEVSQGDVVAMMDQMVKDGTISASEAEKAKIKMKSLSGNQWSDLNSTAEKVAASRKPASIPEAKFSDLDKAQYNQIENDIKKIMPEN